MAIHWIIRFKSLRAGTVYTASIYDANYEGATPVELIPAGQPFITQEDDDDDIFCPVRTQTGYMRIVDPGTDKAGNPFDWKELIPLNSIERPVKLSHIVEGTEIIDWIGFLQAENFGSRLYGGTQEREIPIQCPISTVSRDIVNVDTIRIRNFAYILHEILNTIPDPCKPTHIIVQGGSDALSWLKKRVDWQMFVIDGDEGAEGAYNLGTMLEDMCLFWGLSARMCGTKLYLTCADDPHEDNALVMTYTQLATLAASGATDAHIESMFADTQTLGNIFGSANNDDYRYRGYNTCTVDVNMGDEATTVINPFDDDLVRDMNRGTWAEGTRESDGNEYWYYTKDVLTADRYDWQASCTEGYAAFNILKKYDNDDSGYDDIGNVIHFKKTYDGVTCVSLETKYEHCFANGFIQMMAETYRWGKEYTDGKYFAGNPAMKMRLGIGPNRAEAVWWDGQSWQPNQCIFLATIGNNKPELFTRYETGSGWDLHYEETNIIETTNQCGRIFVDLLGTDDVRISNINGQKSFDLGDFRIEYSKNDNVTRTQYPNSGWWDIKENLDIPELHYKAHNNSIVKEEYNIDLEYGSNDGIRPSYNILMNEDGSYMNAAPYANGTVNERPEIRLCNRVVDYWAQSKRRIFCDLLTNDGTADTIAAILTPRHRIGIDGSEMYPTSISRNWRDDIATIGTIEVPPITENT